MIFWIHCVNSPACMFKEKLGQSSPKYSLALGIQKWNIQQHVLVWWSTPIRWVRSNAVRGQGSIFRAKNNDHLMLEWTFSLTRTWLLVSTEKLLVVSQVSCKVKVQIESWAQTCSGWCITVHGRLWPASQGRGHVRVLTDGPPQNQLQTAGTRLWLSNWFDWWQWYTSRLCMLGFGELGKSWAVLFFFYPNTETPRTDTDKESQLKIMVHHLLQDHLPGKKKTVRVFIKNVLQHRGSENGKNSRPFSESQCKLRYSTSEFLRHVV